MGKKTYGRMKHIDGKSLATLWTVGTLTAAALLPDGLVGHVRDAYDHFRYSTETASEMVRGTEGERAIKDLSDALRIVGEASATYEDARRALESYNANAQDSIEAMKETYEQNETLMREAKRLNINLQGFYKSVSDIGNDLKPDFVEKIDMAIMEIYGIDPIKAAERSESFKNLYKTIRDFYEERATLEDVVSAAVGSLEEKLTEGKEINAALKPTLEGVAETLRSGYQTEDRVFSEHGRRGEADVEGLGQDVQDYGKNVEMSKDKTKEFADVPEKRNYDWITFLLNPATLGFIGASFVKGASKFLPKIVERPFSYMTALPAHLVLRTAGIAGEKYGMPVLRKVYEGAKVLKNSPFTGRRIV